MTRIAFFVLAFIGQVAVADQSNTIPYHKSIELRVGQSMVVHGYRGECGKRPNNVDKNRTRKTKLGELSIGKWGVAKSRTCGGLTPAVEIVFTAKKKGRENIEVAGDKISVRVR